MSVPGANRDNPALVKSGASGWFRSFRSLICLDFTAFFQFSWAARHANEFGSFEYVGSRILSVD
jgi:hypothetical protein